MSPERTLGSGSVSDIAFSIDPQQAFFDRAGRDQPQVWVLKRDTLEVVSGFGHAGRWAGQFYGAHNIAADAQGNLFVTETYEGKRVQRVPLHRHGSRVAAILQD